MSVKNFPNSSFNGGLGTTVNEVPATALNLNITQVESG